jgi:hypothetical protein
MNSNDAISYASFLNNFAHQLHSANSALKLSVDVASWNPYMWNFTLLAQTELDYIITMDTYGGLQKEWKQSFAYALKTIPIQKLGIGLESTKPR